MEKSSPCHPNPRAGEKPEVDKASADSEGYVPTEEKKVHEESQFNHSPYMGQQQQHQLLPIAEGFSSGIDTKLQELYCTVCDDEDPILLLPAKIAHVKSWACVNFSSIDGEDLLKFLHYLSRTCVHIGMDFRLEPTMLVHMSSPSHADIEHSLWSVNEFFDNHEMEKGQARFLLVILPDARCSDEIVVETCKDIRVVYQCCLPLYDGMAEEYLKNAANEIKAKVIESNKLSDSLKDTGFDEMGEFIDNYEEMSEDDGYDYKETGEDDGYDCEEMEYTCEVERPEASHVSGTPDREMSELQLSPADAIPQVERPKASHVSGTPDREMSEELLLPTNGFTTITDAIPQTKSTNVKTWACANFSSIRGKRLLRFLSKLGNMCMSIGVDLSLEPTILIHINTSRQTNITNSLCTIFDFFRRHKIQKEEALLLVILPEAMFAHVKVDKVCENLKFVYQFFAPWHARRASEKYLKNAAKKLKAKVLQCDNLSDSCDDMNEDVDPEELYSSETGEVCSQQSDFDVEIGVYNELGEDDISENLAATHEESTEDNSCDKESNCISGSVTYSHF